MNQIAHPSEFFSDGFDTKVLNWVKTNKSITEFNSVQWWATLQYIVCTLYIVQLQREKLSEAKMGSGASVIVSSQVIRLLIISSSLLLSFFCSALLWRKDQCDYAVCNASSWVEQFDSDKITNNHLGSLPHTLLLLIIIIIIIMIRRLL